MNAAEPAGSRSLPTFDISRMLRPAALARYHDVTTKGCYDYGHAVFLALGPQIPAYADWAQAPEVRKYLHDSQSGEKPIVAPLLVVAGDVVAIEGIYRGNKIFSLDSIGVRA